MKQSKHEQFMQRAIQLAEDAVLNKQCGPFGAVIVKDDKIIAEACNQVIQDLDPSAHAEVVCIREACKVLGNFSLQGCEIYASCEPCPMCLSAIYWARLSKIYYGNTREQAAKINFDDQFLYDEVNKPLSQRKIPIQHLLPEQAIRAFEYWEQKPDKITY